MLAESERVLQRIVDDFDRVCRRRKLKVNEDKSKAMVFERAREQTIGYVKSDRVGSKAMTSCKIWLGKEKMEGVT